MDRKTFEVEKNEYRIKPRRVLQAFMYAMEEKLRANDHKGHWEFDSAKALLKRLYQEADELKRAIDRDATDEVIIAEAADVANFAMMVADVYRHKKCTRSSADPYCHCALKKGTKNL